jgi:hypothetical protein
MMTAVLEDAYECEIHATTGNGFCSIWAERLRDPHNPWFYSIDTLDGGEVINIRTGTAETLEEAKRLAHAKANFWLNN